jgi:negative regulator of flagellin synthesis FlgM
MKIDSSYKPALAPVTPRTPQAPSTAGSTQEAVSLSPLAGSLQNSEKPPVNSARIQEIRQAISENRFTINPEAIADRLIETARDLVGKRQA